MPKIRCLTAHPLQHPFRLISQLERTWKAFSYFVPLVGDSPFAE
uniref:Uncharacterized protein n=1 Tax=Candidatus Kentrum sp. LFY TaxID=2126342 RepID=A0A450UHG2_9GAMM|nr:MAG: hypothetical protein BECKLFY1418A_GA0070994_101936 [Candidatus Kentron sp. LFY]